MRRTTDRPRSRRAALLGALAGLATLLSLLVVAPSSAVDGAGDNDLYLVTLRGPGTAGSPGFLTGTGRAARMHGEQDAVLDAVDAPAPLYRWTTALNGFAVTLDDDQVAALESDPTVATVERNEVRPLAGSATDLAPLLAKRLDDDRPRSGGAGTVIGIIDTGLAPGGPLFAQVRHPRRGVSFG